MQQVKLAYKISTRRPSSCWSFKNFLSFEWWTQATYVRFSKSTTSPITISDDFSRPLS